MKIKSGDNFTILLTDRGEVYSWGDNESGQLGIGTADAYYHKPAKIEFILDIPIRYISVGFTHAAAIDFDYNVYIWGSNNDGQLGLGDNVDRSRPTIIENLTEKKIEKIYCNYNHTVAITQNDEAYSWGNDHYGILGIGNNNDVNTPTKLNFPNNIIIKKLYAGPNHSYAIDTCSKIYSWGRNDRYQLCKGDNTDQNSPSIANMLDDFNIDKIICLYNSTIILADNKLYSIGYCYFGEIGLDIKYTKEITIIKEGVEKVWGNECAVFCKMCNGDIYAWGLNYEGQLGISNNINQNIPSKLNIQLDIKSINYCDGVTYAITTSGDIYTWGNNELVSEEPILVPILFTYFIDKGIEIKTMNRTKSARKN